MRLTAVEIHGFKSFANKTRLEFGPGITAIIGPNGSGKSNVAEAIRWVLGERSLKELRGKKTGDVIFSGSNSRHASTRAYVSLTFDNESGRFPIEAPEITIKRVVTKEGESEYTVNGDFLRLIDLEQILAQAGIGTKSYTVISQGMVDRYLYASPEARRELFDEATGIKALQLKLHQTHLKLDKTQQYMSEVRMIMRELEPRLTVLRRQMQRYEEREDLQQLYLRKQEQWFAHSWHTASREIARLDVHIQELDKQITQARHSREQIEHQLLDGGGHPSSHIDELVTELERARAEFAMEQERYEHLQQDQRDLSQSIEHIVAQRRKAEKALEESRHATSVNNILTKVCDTLRQSSAVLHTLISHQQPDYPSLQTLLKNIDGCLHDMEHSSASRLDQLTFEKLLQPLQDVARLKGIEEERTRQLERLPPLHKPSDKRVTSLQLLLKREQASTRKLSGSPTRKTLEQVREVELAAERERGAAATALQQAQQEQVTIEQHILRERGSTFLSHIKSLTRPSDQHIPSEQELFTLSSRIAALGEPDPLVAKEFEEVSRRYSSLQEQMKDIQQTKQSIMRFARKLEFQMQITFRTQFSVIQSSFSSNFCQLFGGGKALLNIADEGIDITVIPPGKRARHVTLLSGGEKALTSLALLFAILQASKPPFIVLDEVDAALDEANSMHFVKILQQHSKHTQCIVISHNRQTMATASVLYGVTMQREGVSKIYSVRLSDMQEIHKLERDAEEKIAV